MKTNVRRNSEYNKSGKDTHYHAYFLNFYSFCDEHPETNQNNSKETLAHICLLVSNKANMNSKQAFWDVGATIFMFKDTSETAPFHKQREAQISCKRMPMEQKLSFLEKGLFDWGS